MKVKVGNRIYDGEIEPVMVILSTADKANIAAMADDATRYCSYPTKTFPEVVEASPYVLSPAEAYMRSIEAWMQAEPSQPPTRGLMTEGVCRVCGCTEGDACIEEQSGEHCSWANEARTLCTFCDDPVAQV